MRDIRQVAYKGVYHICNKSISNYEIFGKTLDKHRFLQSLEYYNVPVNTFKLSFALRKKIFDEKGLFYVTDESIVKFIAFCVMPDHYHLLLKVLDESLFTQYISNIENSYTRFFNTKHNRKGPLWQSRFRLVKVKTNNQLLHLSRYLHINPTTAGLVEKPEDWAFSSYRDYIFTSNFLKDKVIEISISNPVTYQKFTNDRIDYQKTLKRIKKLLLD